MKKRILITVLIVMLFACVLAVSVNADEFKLTYTVSDGKATITGYTGDIPASGDLVIPDMIGGYPVTAIGEDAFLRCYEFTGSLTIPDSVMSIGDYAFYNCYGFTGSLTIPDSVTTIGDYAFNNCYGFTGSLTIGSNVADIGVNSFTGIGCSEISSNTKYYKAEEGILYNSDYTEIISCLITKSGTLTIPDSVTAIGDYAFYGCDGFTGSLTIPNSVTIIGDYAFVGCSGFTGSLTIPDSVTTIGYAAFCNCSDFTGSLTIPDSVTAIGDNAFEGCCGFTGSLTIGNSVTTIGDYAFDGCYGFTGSLAIPDSVTSIGDYAFCNCSGFTGSLMIGSSVTTIGDSAFAGCNNISDVYFMGNAPSVTWGGFNKTVTLHYLTSTSGWTGIDDGKWNGYDIVPFTGGKCGDSAYWMLKNDGTLVINGTGSMYDYSEKNLITTAPWNEYADDLTALNIGNGITGIGEYAFDGCTGLTGSLTIPDSVTTIGDYAFVDCYGFTGSLTIPDSVTTIGNFAFYYCYGFTGSLTIGSNVADIGANPFAGTGCSEISSNSPYYKAKDGILYNSDYTEIISCLITKSGTLTIPDSVTAIGDYAFGDCSGFTGSLTIPDSVTTIGDHAFDGCYGFTGSLTIPGSVTTIGEDAFALCSRFTGSLTIPGSVTSIGDDAFCNCSGFTGSLMIGSSVTTIGNYAFAGCDNISDVYFMGNVPSVAWGSFNTTVTLHYLTSTSDWTGIDDGKWNGYDIVPLTGGKCGEKALWFIDADNTLIITGSGDMDDYDSDDPPWSGCEDLEMTGLVIENGITGIGNYAFLQFDAMTGDLIIPDSVKSIGNYAFRSCDGFDGRLAIGSGVTDIGEGAFYGCSGFTDGIVIPAGVTAIGTNAFYGCYGISSVYFMGNAPSVTYSGAFDSGAALYYRASASGWTEISSGIWNGYSFGTFLVNDLDGDGKENISDAVHLLWSLLGKDTYELPVYASCDYDGNGTVNASDAVYLLWSMFYPEEYTRSNT